MKLFKPWGDPDLTEIATYIRDLEEVSELRDRANLEDEIARYDVIIECMQRALMTLVE